MNLGQALRPYSQAIDFDRAMGGDVCPSGHRTVVAQVRVHESRPAKELPHNPLGTNGRKKRRAPGQERVLEAVGTEWQVLGEITRRADFDRVRTAVALSRLTDRGEVQRRGEKGGYEWRRR